MQMIYGKSCSMKEVGTTFAVINVSPIHLPLLQLYSYENRCNIIMNLQTRYLLAFPITVL
jgi:hypothetical protein